MRHYLCSRGAALAQLAHAGRVFVTPAAALLVATAGLALSNLTGNVGAACSAVPLATITLAAH
jgi:hypothetical protein